MFRASTHVSGLRSLPARPSRQRGGPPSHFFSGRLWFLAWLLGLPLKASIRRGETLQRDSGDDVKLSRVVSMGASFESRLLLTPYRSSFAAWYCSRTLSAMARGRLASVETLAAEKYGTEGSRFRGDIEGLRAVAVALVLIYHAGAPWLPGGFVGVDVFFVISGYLITSHLVRELRDTGTIRFGAFYARRAKRLLPAAGLVLVATAVLALLILPSTRWTGIGWDIFASTFYSMNWRLAAQSVDYLAAGEAASPVQHFWSLGVEEQYYLVWPLLLVIATFWLRPRRSGTGWTSRRRKYLPDGARTDTVLVTAFLLIAVPSLMWSVHMTATNPGAAYFVTTTRMWELAIGSLVAIAASHLTRLPTLVAAALGWTALAVLVATGAFLTTATPFPGWIAIAPTVATAAIIAVGPAAGRRGPASLLAFRPLVWLGAISYAVYLWHWPLLVTVRAVIPDLTWQAGLLIAAASLLPAWLSTRLLENPIRRGDRFAPQGMAAAVGFGASAAGLLAGLAVVGMAWPPAPPPLSGDEQTALAVLEATQGDEGGEPAEQMGAALLTLDPAAGEPVDTVDQLELSPEQAKADNASVFSDGCHQRVDEDEPRACVYGENRAAFTVAIVGDSHAGQWVPALQVVAATNEWRLLTYTKSSCPLTSATVTSPGGSDAPYANCATWNERVMAALTGPDRPDLVVVSSERYRVIEEGAVVDGPAGDALMATGLADAWRKLTAAGVQVAVLRDTPRPGIDVPECVAQHLTDLTQCSVPQEEALASIGAPQQAAVAQIPGVPLLDLDKYICPASRCSAVIGRAIVYRDTNHMTATYSRSLAGNLDAAMKGIPGVPPGQ